MRRRLMGSASTTTGTSIPLSDVVAGDICFYDSATDSKVFYNANSLSNVPDTATPIGVVVIPSSHNVYGDGSCGVMSIKPMNCSTPATGGTSEQEMYWGVYDTDIITLSNLNQAPYVGTGSSVGDASSTVVGQYLSTYLPSDKFSAVQCPHDDDAYYYSNSSSYRQAPSPYLTDGTRNPAYYQTSSPSSTSNALADFDGVGNTKKIIAQRGIKDYSSWLPTYNKEADYPAASCCDMFYTDGTKQGDWYLPACGELGYITPPFNKINQSIAALKSAYGDSVGVQLRSDTLYCYRSSSEYSSKQDRGVHMVNGTVSSYNKHSMQYVRAWLRVTPPPTQANIGVTFDDNDSGALLTSNGISADWIKGRRCLAKPQSDGSVSICYLDENNSELYHDGTTAADLSGAQGQWMTDIPEYWFYMDESVTDKHTLYLSPTEVEGWKHSRRVLVGVTEAVNVDGKLWSRKISSGEQSTGNLTPVVFHNYANAIGNGWDIIDYETHCKIGHLFYAKYLNKDCQTVIGTGEDSYTRTIGTTSSLGNNDGTTDTQISFLGIEDAWDGKYEWMGGIHRNSGTVYIYDGFQPGSVPTVDYRTETIPYGNSYLGCITKMQWGDNADMLPIAYASGSNYSQGYFDHGRVDSSGWLVAGRSSSNASLYGGVAYLYFIDSPSGAAAKYGSRIQYRGTINIVDDITTFESLSIA